MHCQPLNILVTKGLFCELKIWVSSQLRSLKMRNYADIPYIHRHDYIRQRDCLQKRRTLISVIIQFIITFLSAFAVIILYYYCEHNRFP